MEPPAKRQKVSQDILFPIPTPTLDLSNFQRPAFKRRYVGHTIAPRAPDVTVTAAVVEVAVNGGSTATQVTVSTGNVAVSLGTLGTVTVPGVEPLTKESTSGTSSGVSSASSSVLGSAPSSASSNSSSDTALSSTLFLSTNSTISSIATTDRTVTVTATSTFHVSYTNGTFITPIRTHSTGPTGSISYNSDGDENSTGSGLSSGASGGYVFGQDVSDTYTALGAPATGTAYNAGITATATASGAYPPTSSASGNDGDGGVPTGPVLTPQQTQMVGGIVGGVAGIALVLVIILYVLRWYRQRLKLQGRLPKQLRSGKGRDIDKAGLAGMAAPMSQSGTSLFGSAALGAGMKKFRSGSDTTFLTSTTSTTGADSEKGFHRISGRKIPSVLSTGGDQFGGSYGAFEEKIVTSRNPIGTAMTKGHHHDLSDSSFYRDTDGTASVGSDRPASPSAPASPMYPPIFTASALSQRRPSMLNQPHKNTSTYDFAVDDFDRAFARNTCMSQHISSFPTATPANSEGFAVSRNSPARTPVIQSPTTSSLRLPIEAPLSMDADVPEMPLPSPGLVGGGLGHDLARQRMPSGLSARSVATSGSGRFRENVS